MSREIQIELYPGWILRPGGSFDRIGNLVVFSGTFSKSSAIVDGEEVFTLPQACLPESTEVIGFPALVTNKATNARMIISPTTGIGSIHAVAASERTSFNVTGSWRMRG